MKLMIRASKLFILKLKLKDLTPCVKGVSQEPFFKTRMTDECEVRTSVVEQTEQWPLSVQCTGLSGSQPSHYAMLQIY